VRKTGFLIAASVIPLVAHAETYLSQEQALESLFPGEKFARKEIDLSSEDVKKIEDASGETVRAKQVVAWVGSRKNVVIVDQALGKHEFITYVVGITPAKKVKGIEILEYRESYGSQIRGEAWRKQFEGKDASASLKLGKDVVNISGATLSCAHVTSSVRRVLHTYDTIAGRI
jgi:Na+-translocating ferredoxin:NAD+ oxidoreductase RnfG subunit